MARTFRATPTVRIWNRIATLLIRNGLGAARWRVLTVAGRRTGRPYSTPVSLLTIQGRQWLVSPYGPTGWAANARASGQVTLRRGRDVQRFRVAEVSPSEATPVLRAYLAQEPITRPYFDVTAESTDAELAVEAPQHPVFALDMIAPTS